MLSNVSARDSKRGRILNLCWTFIIQCSRFNAFVDLRDSNNNNERLIFMYGHRAVRCLLFVIVESLLAAEIRETVRVAERLATSCNVRSTLWKSLTAEK